MQLTLFATTGAVCTQGVLAGYGFGRGEFVGVWRHLVYKIKRGNAIDSIRLDGPAIAAVWRW